VRPNKSVTVPVEDETPRAQAFSAVQIREGVTKRNVCICVEAAFADLEGDPWLK
jgi:hypothetical protein